MKEPNSCEVRKQRKVKTQEYTQRGVWNAGNNNTGIVEKNTCSNGQLILSIRSLYWWITHFYLGCVMAP